MDMSTKTFSIQTVYVGLNGELLRYKVVDENGQYVRGGLFKSYEDALRFIEEQK